MKFKVGDLVFCKGASETSIITKIDDRKIYHKHLSTGEIRIAVESNFDLYKETSMSKYDELKGRIEALENGWDREADDILQEILEGQPLPNSNVYFQINASSKENDPCWIYIFDKNHNEKIAYGYHSQCEKMSAFKKALLWLLENSDIKKDLIGTEQKIELEGKVYKAKILEAL